MNSRNVALPGSQRPGLRGWSRFALISALLLAIVGLLGSTTEPALAGSAVAPLQANGTLSLKVVSTDTDAPIGTYKYLINLDNTGNPWQGRYDGCHPDNANYPASCQWPSIRQVPGAAPIVLQGTQADFDGVSDPAISLPPGKYLVSVLAPNYRIDGTHFVVTEGGAITVEGQTVAQVEVGMHPYPLPAATMRIQVFEDISPVNGQLDAPAEGGLPGFHAVINDTAGEISADIFGNPLCTTYDAGGNPNGKTNCLVSGADGIITVPNLGPLRYDVVVVPPEGQGWTETTTLEGSPSWDTWLTEGGTGLDNEFVIAGEPTPLTVFGFTRAKNNLAGGGGGVKGTLVSASVFMPQTNAIPYYGDIWNGFSGTKINGPIEDGWVALSDLQAGDTAVYVGKANPDGTYEISGVPDGDYLFTWWDGKLHHILDWIQVTVSNGQMYDMGTPMLTGWFTIIDGYVFDDLNQNGVKDTGEPGLSNYTLVYRDRDNSEIDRMSIAVTTDETGYYIFEKAYPMNSWMVVEAYNDRYYTTGFTYQVENQPNPTTIMGGGVDIGVMPVLGQRAQIDWGVRPYDPENNQYPESGRPRNGGIAGSVFYDTTRAEYDARYQAAEPWAPGIPGLTMKLYATVSCGTNPGAVCDARGEYELDTDGSYKKGALLNTTVTETWEQPGGCVARDANGNVLAYPSDQELFENPEIPNLNYRCIEAPVLGTQVQNDFATLDGNWGFGEGCFDGTLDWTNPLEPTCTGGTFTPLTADDYLVEVEIPTDGILGRPKYQVVREEDINVFDGDQFLPAIPPSACAGTLHTVDVAGTGTDGYPAQPYNTGYGSINVPVSTPVDNANFAAEDNGGPHEGTVRPLCDTKLVTVSNGRSIAPTFTLFTEVPIPGKWKGLIIDDLTVSTNKQDVWFGEKPGIPYAPIGVYDYSNRLLTTLIADPNGAYEVLLPSTGTVNAPTPSGVFPGMYYILGNDPGQPGHLNPTYNPGFRSIAATFEVYPGLMVPSDLAPTQIVPGVLAAGSQFGLPPQCTLNDPANPTTPELFAVSRPYANPGGSFSIQGQGFGSPGQVMLDGVALSASTWTDTQIEVTIPADAPVGPHQLEITADNGNKTVNGLTFHVLGGDYNPPVFEVGPGRTYATVQDGIDAAAAGAPNGEGLVVIYPGATAQWNPTGTYFENPVIYSPVKLQGVGPGGVYPDTSGVLGSVIDGRGVAGDTGYATTWRAKVMSVNWSGIQAVYEGPVVYVLANDGEFTDGFKASIDGLRIQGGDQQGFPNNLTPADPGQKEFAAVQGGGIFVNGYAKHLQITNNIMESNGGAYGGAIRLGTPNLGDYNSQNDNVSIAHNRILANGGTNLAGAIGIFSGANGYEVAHNDICGNYTAEYGGGISHYGYSPDGKIHDNRVYFNRAYDEGGGIMIAGELPANPGTLSRGSGPVDIYNNLIQNNLSNDDGGGLRFLMAGGPVSMDEPKNVYNNIIVNNVSTHEGGGVALNDTPNVNFFNNTVMKNLTTATAMTSYGQPAPAGLSTSLNSVMMQGTLPGGSPNFSNPLLFNNIFWDNRAGSFGGSTVAGIGLINGETINNWDMGVAGSSQLLSPTSSLLQSTKGVDTSNDGDPILRNIYDNPIVENTYDTTVSVAPWRGNPRFVDIMMVTVLADPNGLGDYHLTGGSPAIDEGVYIKDLVKTPKFDIDNDLRPRSQENPADIGADEQSGATLPDVLLYFSTWNGGDDASIPGVTAPYDDADIYTWNGEQIFDRIFDASAMSLAGGVDIDALMVDYQTDPLTYYMSFNNRIGSLGSLGTVEDEDVVSYNNGTWSLFFDGSLCGLDEGNANGRDIDALDINNGTLYFSTWRDANFGGMTGHRSNIYRWDGNTCSLVFDGSNLGNANIDGLTYIGENMFYASFENTQVPNMQDPLTGQPIQDEDVMLYDNGNWFLHFDGTAKGLTGGRRDVDALSIPQGAPMIVGQRALAAGPTSSTIYLPLIMK